MNVIPNCARCALCTKHKKIVLPKGPSPARVMFIGDGPNYVDNITGIPFHEDSQTGEELVRLCWSNSIDLSAAKVDLLIRCPIPKTGPKVSEIRECSYYLEESIKETNPEIIVPLGHVSTQYFLGNSEMEMVNGIPHYSSKYDCIIYPIFHPGAGINKPEILLKIVAAFAYLKLLLKGETNLREHKNFDGLTLPLHQEDDFHGKEDYKLITNPHEIYSDFYANCNKFVAIDTETVNGQPWGLSYSLKPGHGRVIMNDDKNSIEAFKYYISFPNTIVLLHNALFDLHILKKMGITIPVFKDTMIMAYLLQSEPQGLKPLAFRHCGMEMSSYAESVNIKDTSKGLEYLKSVLEQIWPDPEPFYQFNATNVYKIVKPQNIAKTVTRILNDNQNPEKNINIRDRWTQIAVNKGRGMVEDVLGTMPEGTISDIPIKDAIFYSCRDADATFRVYPILLKKIKAMELENVFEVDCSVVPMVDDMQRAGIKIDPDYLRSLSTYFEGKKAEIAIQLYAIYGEPFNIGSPLQIAVLLFDKLGLKELKKRSTGIKILKQFKDEHPAVDLIIKWRKYEKLNNTYAKLLPKFCDKDNRIHASILLTRTATGRMSMKKPNLMAQPKHGEESKMIRKGFIARDGCHLVSSDYSQIELRVLAHEANESSMIQDFIAGEDIHLNTAVRIFKVPEDQITPMQRFSSKRVNFGIPYGVQPQGLMEQLASQDAKGWSYSKCQELINNWYQTYSQVHKYMIGVQQFAQRYGYVRDMWGRVRFVPSVKSSNKWAQLEALRQAGNMPIQAGAAGVIKKAMASLIPVYKGFQKAGYICNPLLQIHDDLLFEVQDAIIDIFVLCLIHHMESVAILKVPIKVDVEVGKTWSEMLPYKEWIEMDKKEDIK